MDIEPTSKKHYKTEWLNQNSFESFTKPRKINISTIFNHSYFWVLYLLSVSYCTDFILYLVYYQEKFEIIYYDEATLVLRYINDVIFIFPLLLFIKFQKTARPISYIIAGIIFLPQLVINIVSLIKIYTQDYCLDDDTILCDRNRFPEDEDIRFLNHFHITLLRISTLINLILYVFAVALTFLKIIRNY